jgi:poly(glycerol-phosphate) alpha-glucosyltransferase
MIKLAVITDCLSRNAGGLFNSVMRLAQEMQNPRCQVFVFGVADAATAEDLHHWEPLQPRVMPLRGPRFFGYAPGLVDTIRDVGPDTIQIHGLWKYATIAVLRVHRAIGCPYVVNPHGMLDPWAMRNSRWKKRLASLVYERRHLRRAGCIRALCRSEAAAIRAYGVRTPICIIPNAIDVPSDVQHGQACPAPFPPDRKVLLYLGRLHPKKGLVNLLQAWSRVQQTAAAGHAPDEWLLAIAGWDQGGHEAKLRRLAAELGLRDKVAFLGPQFDQRNAACYRHCEAFVLPSFSEGLPMVVLEAWAYGKPVLMTPECNLSEGFSACAALRIETSPECIAQGLRELLEMSAAERHTMGQRGLSLVKQRYTWMEVARQMHEVQDWLLARGAAPGCVEFAK